MEYNLIVNREKKSAEAMVSGQAMKISTGSAFYDVSFESISNHQILLNVNGKHFNAFFLNGGDEKTIIINGRSYEVKDADQIDQDTRMEKSFATAATTVSSPMPAVVTDILVKVDDRVVKGQGLIIVSAMKMETTLTAPFEGRVSRINAKISDKVMPTEILVDIEQPKESI